MRLPHGIMLWDETYPGGTGDDCKRSRLGDHRCVRLDGLPSFFLVYQRPPEAESIRKFARTSESKRYVC